MKRLNNRGMTSVEVLISFVVVVIISVSMYGTVSSYQNKEHIESCKEKIMTYKNLLTKEINDDLIKKGLVAVQTEDFDETKSEYRIVFVFKNGEKKRLIITMQKAYELDSDLDASKYKDDIFIISYGDIGNETKYPLPNLGEDVNQNNKRMYDLRISTVDISTKNGVFSLYVGFSHPDLENRYFFNIVCPINF